MKTYLVGGAVRNQLLGLPVKERDWVVIGSTAEEMQARGFLPVGRDFPVFLHPKTKEEYALARTERKTGPGYRGFVFHAGPAVTLEQDLTRRDLTINAMAMDEAGQLIDPTGGQRDLEARVLRHISPAFAEDPVRILRTARFAAQLQPAGFRVVEKTTTLMKKMVENGEVSHLAAERVWLELGKALAAPAPAEFLRVLRSCGALAAILPEVEQLFGVPQVEKYHPEIDTGVHILMVLEQAARLSEDPVVRFAALTHDLGKGVTPKSEWPKHHGHEERGVRLVQALCRRLKVPNAYQLAAIAVCRYHTHCHRALSLRAETVMRMLEGLDALRRPSRLQDFLLACKADARGRTGHEEDIYAQAEYIESCAQAALQVSAKSLQDTSLAGKRLGAAIRRARVQAIGEVPKPQAESAR